MATNPQAAGQTRINFQISEEDRDKLQKLADASGMKLSAYIRLIMEEAVSDELVFTHSPERKPKVGTPLRELDQPPMAAEDPAPYGAKKPRPSRTGNDQAG